MNRTRTSLLQRLGRAELVALIVMACMLSLPAFFEGAALVSVLTQFMIAVMGALSVYIMLRMDLMFFAVPAFMAIGGYTAAILSVSHDITDLFFLTLAAFGLPFLVAIPLGLLILRMKGVYFVLVTFVIAEIMPLVLFETPGLTGGSNGVSSLPPVSVFDFHIETNAAVLMLAAGLAFLATLLTVLVTRILRNQFDAIRENEVLAQSLGMRPWIYKVTGFCFAAGIAGLGGFALVEMLMTAHPSSFAAMTAINYVAYAVVGGYASILGPIVGAGLLVWATNMFSLQGELSPGLFGILLIVAVVFARGGILGLVCTVCRNLGGRGRRQAGVVKGEPA